MTISPHTSSASIHRPVSAGNPGDRSVVPPAAQVNPLSVTVEATVPPLPSPKPEAPRMARNVVEVGTAVMVRRPL
jgi:hypothetical protein